MNPAFRFALVLVPGFAIVAAFGIAQQARPKADAAFFAQKVAPILQENCFGCHNADKARGGLDLSTRDSTLTGGDKGPAIVPGDAAKSLLAKMVRGPSPKMPQKADPLKDADVELILHWIDGGAAWPKDFSLSAKKDAGDWWSLQPIVRPTVPSVKNEAWAKSVLDRFILAMLEANGLTPSAEADPATLIRRVTFDLHGLPPTPAEVDAFVKAWDAPNAKRDSIWEQLVDRLLASPRYGERWARLWLDLVHYADTHGYDKDKKRLWAWLYRDWVIRAFNSDMPYRRFIRAQVAGDVLFPGDPDGIIATGFIVAGPWDFVGQLELREGTVDKEKTRVLDRDDMVANTISTFCSLTVHCARCHDHKFDPIPMKEYYQLQAVFAGVERGDRVFKDKEKAFAAVPIAPRPIHVLTRGDVERKGALATPGALSLLQGLDRHFEGLTPNALTPGPSPKGRGEESRAALANWIADDANVLTWRSIVNRVWQYHFGKGLVDTPSDFGRNGSRPTHPELLDWLAAEFRDADSFKKLHRTILLSATYRQASRHDVANAKRDGDNRYLWKMNRRRLDAESIRDSVLAISGKMDYKMHGPGYELFRFKDDHSPIYDHLDVNFINRPESWRRTIYRFTVRSVPNPFLETLDCADPNINVPVRNTTMTALQALALLNNPFVVKQAEFFAERVKAMEKDPERQVDAMYRLAFSRAPTMSERTAMTAYVRQHGLANACRLMFNANEFMFVD
jgi:mono/diheme cytochrome c family protein